MGKRSDKSEESTPQPSALTDEELAAESADQLPDREAMSTINLSFGVPIDNFAMPINEAFAQNVNSITSSALADADQVVIVDQADTD
jgi:hypothetical protein